MTWDPGDDSNNYVSLWCNTPPYEMMKVRWWKYKIQYDLDDWNDAHYIDTWIETTNKIVQYCLVYDSWNNTYTVYLNWIKVWEASSVSYSSKTKKLWIWTAIADDNGTSQY